MSKGVIVALVIILVGAGIFVISKENQKAAQLEQMMLGEVEQASQEELIENK